MAVSSFQLNHFERILFKCTVGLGSLLIVIRVGAIVLLIYLHHAR